MSDITGFRLTGEGDRAVLAVLGPLDHLSGPSFSQLVRRCLGGPDAVTEIVIDLASSPFVTAAGFRALLQAATLSTESGCQLRVEHQRQLVQSTIGVLGLESVLC